MAKAPRGIDYLVRRLYREGWKDIPWNYKFEVIYLSPVEKIAGLWCWRITGPNGFKMGSKEPVKKLLEAETIYRGLYGSIHSTDPFPEENED